MLRAIIIFFFFATLSCKSDRDKDSNLEGKIYRDLKEINEFSEFTDEGGGSIDYLYAIACAQNPINDNTRLIVFEKIHRIGDRAKYSIVDTLWIRNIPKNHYVDYSICRLNGKEDSEIIVLYEYEDIESYTKIKKAWRADRKLKKIIEIKTKGIDCPNEGYGE